MKRFKKRAKYFISKHVKNLKRQNKIRARQYKKSKASTKADRITKEYIAWRSAVFERDDYTCQRCEKVDCYLEAHHIRPWSLFPKDRFDVNNGATLCRKCHGQVHRSKKSKFLDLGNGRNEPAK